MFGISVGGMLPLKTRFLLCLHEHWMMLATLFQSVAFLLAQQACGLSLSPFRHRNKRWSASPHLRALKLWQMELNQKSQTHNWWLMLCGSSWTTNSGNAKDATEHVLLPSSPFQFRTGRHFPVSFHFVQVLCRCWSPAEMLWWGFPPLLLCLPAYRFSRSVPLSLYRWPGMVDQWCSHASSFLCSYFLHWSDQNLMVISLDLCLTPPLLILIFAQDFHSSSSTPCTLKQYWKDRIFLLGTDIWSVRVWQNLMWPWTSEVHTYSRDLHGSNLPRVLIAIMVGSRYAEDRSWTYCTNFEPFRNDEQL